jgi:hypothetical protein
MIIIEKTLISDDVCQAFFACDLKLCKGKCCIEGDYGAPLEEDEINILEEEIDKIKPYMSSEEIEVVSKTGVFVLDIDGQFVTPLVENRQCVFVFFENDIANCSIEKAFIDKKISFQKPLSCHLYPLRIQKQPEYDAINYHQWDICSGGRLNGKNLKIPLYKYLKEPLIKKYGDVWYEFLDKYLESKKI